MGYDLNHWSGQSIGITLYWRVQRGIPENLSVGLSFRDSTHREVGAHSSWPISGLRPTSHWQPGEIVVDRHEVQLSSEPSGELDMQVKLLKDGGLELPTDNNRPAVVGIPQVMNDPERIRVNLDNKVLLTGWQIEAKTARPGDQLSVVLHWEPLGSATQDSAVFVHLLGKDGQMRGQHDGIPLYEAYPPVFWVSGRPFRDRHVLKVDSAAPPGEYQLSVGLYVMRTGQRWPVLDRALAANGQADRVLLGPITMQP